MQEIRATLPNALVVGRGGGRRRQPRKKVQRSIAFDQSSGVLELSGPQGTWLSSIGNVFL